MSGRKLQQAQYYLRMYRDERQAACLQLPLLAEVPFPKSLHRVRAQRLGRIAGGVAGIVGAGSVIVSLPLAHWGKIPRELLPPMLLACWPVALVVGVVACGLALLAKPPSGRTARTDALAELAARHADQNHGWHRRRVSGLGFASVALPAVAACLLAPLTLHSLAFLSFSLLDPAIEPLKQLGTWFLWGATGTWLPHLVVCLLAIRHCRRLLSGERVSCWVSLLHLGLATVAALPCAILLGAVVRTGMEGVTRFASGPVELMAVTGLMIFVVAGSLVFVTGVAFLPVTYRWACRRLERERQALTIHA